MSVYPDEQRPSICPLAQPPISTFPAADCVVIVTDHDAYDWTSVRRAARLLVDTRHVA